MVTQRYSSGHFDEHALRHHPTSTSVHVNGQLGPSSRVGFDYRSHCLGRMVAEEAAASTVDLPSGSAPLRRCSLLVLPRGFASASRVDLIKHTLWGR